MLSSIPKGPTKIYHIVILFGVLQYLPCFISESCQVTLHGGAYISPVNIQSFCGGRGGLHQPPDLLSVLALLQAILTRSEMCCCRKMMVFCPHMMDPFSGDDLGLHTILRRAVIVIRDTCGKPCNQRVFGFIFNGLQPKALLSLRKHKLFDARQGDRIHIRRRSSTQFRQDSVLDVLDGTRSGAVVIACCFESILVID